MTLINFILDLSWCRVHFEVTDMIAHEVFVWAEGVRKPSHTELKHAFSLMRATSPDFYFYANVDASNLTNMRFARHFGFVEVYQHDGKSVQLWDKSKCKQLSSL